MTWNSPIPPCVIDFDQQFYSLFITPLRSCFSPTGTIKRWLFIFITWLFLKADINNARNCSHIPSDIANNSNSVWSLQIWKPIRHCSLKAFSEYFTTTSYKIGGITEELSYKMYPHILMSPLDNSNSLFVLTCLEWTWSFTSTLSHKYQSIDL